jgi:hypothetical protein
MVGSTGIRASQALSIILVLVFAALLAAQLRKNHERLPWPVAVGLSDDDVASADSRDASGGVQGADGGDAANGFEDMDGMDGGAGYEGADGAYGDDGALEEDDGFGDIGGMDDGDGFEDIGGFTEVKNNGS